MSSRILEDNIYVLGLGLEDRGLGLGLEGRGLGLRILALTTSLASLPKNGFQT